MLVAGDIANLLDRRRLRTGCEGARRQAARK
jgi:hypothetical protein